ncbi:MAG: orotate phosphoribosyltransferase [Clostridiales bacterium]|jgi:orotate phosphoribosyltransferase|nr:orotate phosphoribosyltransferase [Clostridiales bacterium]
MITEKRVLEILKEAGVLLEGHFLLTSGRHSSKYLQCAKIFQHTKYSEELCKALAEKFKDENVDVVIGPAIGAILISYEVSRWLRVKNIFAERENGVMTLRRNFTIEKGQNVLVVEDVVTTGGSVKEVMKVVEDLGGKVIGVGAIVDRTGGKINFGTKFESVISLNVESYEPDQCLLCKQGIPVVKPGSRNI